MTRLRLDATAPGVEGEPPWGEVAVLVRDVNPAPDLLVVGAGLLGLSVAAEAMAAGLGAVQVVDRGPAAGGASGRNAGALLPEVHALTATAELTALHRRGFALHQQRAAALGYPLRPIDWLVVGAAPPVGGTARRGGWLGDPAAVASATGGLVTAQTGLLVPDQAVTDPVAVAKALAATVEVVTGVHVNAVEPGERPVVRTSAGTIRPGRVVVAVGPDPLARPPAQRWVTGHLALTAPLDPPLGVGVSADIVVLPAPDGRLLVGGTRDGQHLDGAIDAAVVGRIGSALAAVVPSATEVAFERIWTGQRPVAADDLPLVDEHGPGVVVAGGLFHTGVLSCLAVAEGIIAFLRDGDWPSSLRAFHRRAVRSPDPARSAVGR